MKHVEKYIRTMAEAGVPMTSDEFAPRTRNEVTSDLKKIVKRGYVSKTRDGRFVFYSVSPEQLAEYLKIHARAAKKVTTKREPVNSIRMQLLERAALPSGVASTELPGRTVKAVSTAASALTNDGVLHVFRQKPYRWFTTAEARDAYAEKEIRERPATVLRRSFASPNTPQVVVKTTRWAKEIEPYYPVDEQGRPLYKITIAPVPPAPMKTNTFSGAY